MSLIEAPRVEYEKLSYERLGESYADIRSRAETARQRQSYGTAQDAASAGDHRGLSSQPKRLSR